MRWTPSQAACAEVGFIDLSMSLNMLENRSCKKYTLEPGVRFKGEVRVFQRGRNSTRFSSSEGSAAFEISSRSRMQSPIVTCS